MDPVIISLVSAVAGGAIAAAKGVASSAVKDAYAGLRRLIVDRYERAVPFVEAIEADPESEPEKTVLAKQLDQAGVSDDDELKAAVQAVLEALEGLRAEPSSVALLDFDTFRSLKNFEVEDAEVLGTLFRARNAFFEGDTKLKNIRQASAFGVSGKKH